MFSRYSRLFFTTRTDLDGARKSSTPTAIGRSTFSFSRRAPLVFEGAASRPEESGTGSVEYFLGATVRMQRGRRVAAARAHAALFQPRGLAEGARQVRNDTDRADPHGPRSRRGGGFPLRCYSA